jgi:hypothetical protein
MEMVMFWVAAVCSLVEDYQHFRDTCFSCQGDESLIALMMEAARTSGTLVNFYQSM